MGVYKYSYKLGSIWGDPPKLTPKLTPQGEYQKFKSSSKVTANISNFIYSAITIGVLDPN